MKYPEMRNELIDYLEGLASLTYQKSCWVDGICPAGVEHDELDYTIHFLFDDTSLADKPEEYIGIILKDKEEALVVKRVGDAIELVLRKYGGELTDAEYIGLPEWANVIDAAIDAVRKIQNR